MRLDGTPASTSRRDSPSIRLALVCVATFVVYLDASITPVAVPAIRADLHADVTAAQWLLDAYTLGFACLLLTAGSVGDRFGRKATLLTGTAGFTACSVACALAPSPGILIAARGGQGVFAAAIVPLSLAVTAELFADPRQRTRAIGVWGGVAGTAVALGPIIGGLLVQTAGWESMFWINLPIGVVALAGLSWTLPSSPPRRPSPNGRAVDERHDGLPGTAPAGGVRRNREAASRPDTVGQTLFVLGSGSLTFAMIESGRFGWSSPVILGLLLGSAVILTLFVLWEIRCPHPMLPPRLLRVPAVAVACVVNFLGLFGMYAVLFLLTVYLQETRHLSPVETGVRFLALTGFLGVASMGAAAVVARLGTRTTMLLGLLLVAAGLGGLTLVEEAGGYFTYGWALVLLGAGIPLSSGVVAIQAMMSSVPADLAGTASGAMNTFRQFGAVFGVALAGVLSPQRGDAVTSMNVTFIVAAAGALAGAVVTVIVLRERGDHASRAVPTAEPQQPSVA
ncbi:MULTISPECIES: MFS transporter [Protofrankia]|uniref:Major facilitator superfamily MFS_1 n=1 Tax=Candidatus Protofrankia datiscae TaxID=2716812 RepID=F8B6M1_9ACTN|nr:MULTISPECIES: MFS transporter [Protofrankia]AEH10230.1 major facilitator superfamily MFS_1 [Candidatus Protofrankia datiscae]